MTPEQQEAEFEMFLARAGMVVPPERRAHVFGGYADLRAQMDVLHTRRDATHEPSNVFSHKVPTS